MQESTEGRVAIGARERFLLCVLSAAQNVNGNSPVVYFWAFVAYAAARKVVHLGRLYRFSSSVYAGAPKLPSNVYDALLKVFCFANR